MIVVLSDLHLTETKSSQIGPYQFNRNLRPENYHAYFVEINKIALANGIEKIDLVLAGDILEISRSGIWLNGDKRPYMDNDAIEPGSDAEATILEIISAIAEDERASQTLTLFAQIEKYFDMSVQVHLILGNHDRLVNATPKIRATVRGLFGLIGGDDLFDHHLILSDRENKPFCLIRHGHEYDRMNFSVDVHKWETIPTFIAESVYARSCLGDITTIEFGASLPWLFVKTYGEEAILSDHILMALYQRLMEFDDVRPTTAWLSFLFSTPGVAEKQTWELMKPCFTEIIHTLSNNEPFVNTLKQSDAIGRFGRWLLMAIIRSGLIKNGVPYWMVKMLMNRVSKTIKLKSQAEWAKREELIQNEESGCKCVISGHSHFAELALLSAKNGDERYYINTGTWRNVIPATQQYDDFGRLKALTKVIVFYPMEKADAINGRTWSFHYLSGVSFGDYRLI
jgi:UDP-2,3-diacylglucosamine pyrophosphatase LpxH